MPVVKKYSYSFPGNEQDFFLRLFVDTEKDSGILAINSFWDDGDDPKRFWKGKVNMNSRTFAIRRMISSGAGKRTISNFTIRGKLGEGPETRLEIEFSLSIFTIVFQLISHAFGALIVYGILQSVMGLIAGVCVLVLPILLNVLDFNKSFNRLQEYLPSKNAYKRKGDETVKKEYQVEQAKRYLK